MVTKLFRIALGLFFVTMAACESILEIPVGLRGSERYVCENQNCLCACGYVKCAPGEETCESRCDSQSFMPAPEEPTLAMTTPTLLVANDVVYAVYRGGSSATPGIVCHRGVHASSDNAVSCAPCEYAFGEAWLAAFEGSLYVAGRTGACVFGLPDFDRKANLLPSAGRDIAGMTVDTARNELVWLEFATKQGQSVVLRRKNAAGETTEVTLAAHNRPSMLAAHDGRLAWKVTHEATMDCDTLYLGVDTKQTNTCLVIVDDKNPNPTAVEQRSLLEAETLGAIFMDKELYYAVRLEPTGGFVRRAVGANPAMDQTLASNAAIIPTFSVLPESSGKIQLYYGTFAGIVYGGPVDLSGPSGADVIALTGFGDSTQITALSVIPDQSGTGAIAFLNGRQYSGSGSTMAPELRRLAIAPFSCPAQP